MPSRLTDDEFWKLTEELSEPNGSFRSDNLLSNEQQFQYMVAATPFFSLVVMREMAARLRRG